MEQNLSLEVNSSWVDQESPRILWNLNFITVFTRVHHWHQSCARL